MKNRELTAGIWGAGSIARTHAKALKEIGVRVKFVYDIKLENAESVRQICDGDFATDKKEDLLNSDVDVIHLCVPANLHYEFLMELIEKDFNFICEKPLVLNNEEGLKLLEIMKNKNIIGGVGFNIRFHEGVNVLRENIKSDDFGRLLLVHGSYLQEYHVLPAFYDWRYDEKTAGKMRAVTEIGSHFFDLVQFITRKNIVAVTRTFSNFYKERKLIDGVMYSTTEDGEDVISVDSEDAAIITMKFEDDTLGNVVLSESSPGRGNFLDVEIVGENKTLKWNSEDLNTVLIGEKNKGFRRTTNPFGGGFSDSYINFFNDFYKDVLNGYISEESLYRTLEDGVRNTLICNATYDSAMENSSWMDVEI